MKTNYKPLVDMISETDPNGPVKEYRYDKLGQLILIIDQQDILRMYEYNYSNN